MISCMDCGERRVREVGRLGVERVCKKNGPQYDERGVMYGKPQSETQMVNRSAEDYSDEWGSRETRGARVLLKLVVR